MRTTTYTLSENVSDTMIDREWLPIIGKRAVYTTYDGDRIVGVVEEPLTRFDSNYPIIRFDNGQWGRCDDVVELVMED